jgi:hypothetical protein
MRPTERDIPVPNDILEESRWLAPAYAQCAGHVHIEADREAASDVGAQPMEVVPEDAGPSDAGPADAPLSAAPTLATTRDIAPSAPLCTLPMLLAATLDPSRASELPAQVIVEQAIQRHGNTNAQRPFTTTLGNTPALSPLGLAAAAAMDDVSEEVAAVLQAQREHADQLSVKGGRGQCYTGGVDSVHDPPPAEVASSVEATLPKMRSNAAKRAVFEAVGPGITFGMRGTTGTLCLRHMRRDKGISTGLKKTQYWHKTHTSIARAHSSEADLIMRRVKEDHDLLYQAAFLIGEHLNKPELVNLLKEKDSLTVDDAEEDAAAAEELLLREQVWLKAKLMLSHHQWHELRMYGNTTHDSIHTMQAMRRKMTIKNAEKYGLRPTMESDSFKGWVISPEKAALLAVRLLFKDAPELFEPDANGQLPTLKFKVAGDGTKCGDRDLVVVGLQCVGTSAGVQGARPQSAESLVPLALVWGKETPALYLGEEGKPGPLTGLGEQLESLITNGLEFEGKRFMFERGQMMFTPDMKTAHQFMGITGDGTGAMTDKHFCPMCTIQGFECWRNSSHPERAGGVSDLDKWKAEHAHRHKNPTFRWMGVSPGKLVYCPCMLHCKNRVVERLLASLYRNLICYNKNETVAKRLEETIRTKLSTTHFGFTVIKKDVTYRVYGCVGNHANKLLQFMPSVIPGLFDLNNDKQKEEAARTVQMWEVWAKIDNAASRQTDEALKGTSLLDGGANSPFQAMCNEFYDLFSATYCFDRNNVDHDVRINSNWYMHLVVCHLNEVLQDVGSLRDYSQQGFESNNSLMKRVWRRCTNHSGAVGKNKVKQDALRQMFDWVLLVREGDAEGLEREKQGNMKRNYEHGNRYFGTTLTNDKTGESFVIPKGPLLVELAKSLEVDYRALCRALNTKNGKGSWESVSGWSLKGGEEVHNHGDATAAATYAGSCREYAQDIKLEGWNELCRLHPRSDDDVDSVEDMCDGEGADEGGDAHETLQQLAEEAYHRSTNKLSAHYLESIPEVDELLQGTTLTSLKDTAERLGATVVGNRGCKRPWAECIVLRRNVLQKGQVGSTE